jgi:arylformamidase
MSHTASRSRYAGLAAFDITRLFLVGNTSTSIDSPYHRYPEGCDIARLPIESLVGLEGMCLTTSWRPGTERALAAALDPASLPRHAVLIGTGWDRRWGNDDYWTHGPFLSAELVERLVEGRPALVGVDFATVDDPRDLSRPAHSKLLGVGIPILEHLRGLERLRERRFRLFAAPIAVEGASAMPVRVFAELLPPLASDGNF